MQLRLIGSGVSSAGVHGSGAEVSVTGLKGLVGYRDFFFTYERQDYSWNGAGMLPFGDSVSDPWETLHSMSLGYARQGRINSSWSYFAAGSVMALFEEQMQDSYGFGAAAGATYAYSPALKFTLGAGFAYHEIRTTALPVVGLSWNKGAPTGLSVSVGYPDTHLSYRFSPRWAIRSRIVQFNRDIFRLSDDSAVERKGYLERRDLMADLGLEFTPVKNMSVTLAPRYYFSRELVIYDRNGDNKRTFDVADGWGGLLSVSYLF